MRALPTQMIRLLSSFAPLFSKRVWQNAQVLLMGAILTPGRRTVSSALRAMGLDQHERFHRYHRVLSHASWSSQEASRVLLGLLVETFVPEGDPLVVGIDETLERRWGKRIAAKGVYRDPVRSTHENFVKSSGLRWVCVMLLVEIPWAARVCRLSEVAPLRHKGFDHTTQGAYAAAAGASKGLRLDAWKTMNAVAISGTANNALRVTRTGALSHWKGLAYPNTGSAATHAAFLAMRDITGPQEVFEGNKGFMDAIAGRFEVDWGQEDLEAVTRTIVKKYNAEVHSQSALEGILELREEHSIQPDEVEGVELETFDVAYNIIGGGEEGEKKTVRTKEEAHHSLPYLLAVALLDGEVYPAQYAPERISADDVQGLLRKVEVQPADDLSERFPREMPCRLRVLTKSGEREVEKRDYEGFSTRPISWERATEKFERLAAPYADGKHRDSIAYAVRHVEDVEVKELAELLGKVGTR